jgi:hypothetical protein
LDRDLSESDLQSLTPQRMQEWIAAQNRLDKRRAQKNAGNAPLSVGANGADDEDDQSGEVEYWDGDEPIPLLDGADPNVPGTDDFDPEQFDDKSWTTIYEDSLVDLPMEMATDDDEFDDEDPADERSAP